MREYSKLMYKSGVIDDKFIDRHLLLMFMGPVTVLSVILTIIPGIICLYIVFNIDLESANSQREFIKLLIVSVIWTVGATTCFNRLHRFYDALHGGSSAIVISRFNEDGINTKGLVRVSIAGVRGKLWCTSNGIINAYRGVPVVMLITNMTNDDISKLINSRKGIPKKNVISVYIGAKYKGNQRDIGFIL